MISVLPCCMPRGNFDEMIKDTKTILQDLLRVPEWYLQLYLDNDHTVKVLDDILAARRGIPEATSTNLTLHIGEKVCEAVPTTIVPRVHHLMLTCINNRPWWSWISAMTPHTIRTDDQGEYFSVSGADCFCNGKHPSVFHAPSVKCLWLDLVTNARSTVVLHHLSGFGPHVKEFHLRLLAHELLMVRRRTLALLNAIGRFLQSHLCLQMVSIDLSNTNWKYDAIPSEYLDRFVEMSMVLLDVLHANSTASVHGIHTFV